MVSFPMELSTRSSDWQVSSRMTQTGTSFNPDFKFVIAKEWRNKDL